MDVDEVKRLLSQAASYLGMLAEVEAKCRLLQNKLRLAKARGEPYELHGEEADIALAQMKRDLTKYRRKLHLIHDRLAEFHEDLG